MLSGACSLLLCNSYAHNAAHNKTTFVGVQAIHCKQMAEKDKKCQGIVPYTQVHGTTFPAKQEKKQWLEKVIFLVPCWSWKRLITMPIIAKASKTCMMEAETCSVEIAKLCSTLFCRIILCSDAMSCYGVGLLRCNVGRSLRANAKIMSLWSIWYISRIVIGRELGVCTHGHVQERVKNWKW